MAMYVIRTHPLISLLQGSVQQIWYADDAAAGSTTANLRKWCDLLTQEGPKYGCFPNSAKTYMLVQSEKVNLAREIFWDTGLSITFEVCHYLGSVIGNNTFFETFH